MWIDDDILALAHQPLTLSTWVPTIPMVVLGRSNRLVDEVNESWCKSHGIAILQRYGGGGTVVLYPGCVVVSIGCWVNRKFHNEYYFDKLNQSIIDCIAALHVDIILSQKGISDIALGNKKIGGTSLFRSGNYLLYQASLICQLDIELISNCLCHPSREPDYRQGRTHKDFLTDLSIWNITASALNDHFEIHLSESVKFQIESEIIEPVQKQMKNIDDRLRQGRQNGQANM